MYFGEESVASLPDDPFEALHEMQERFEHENSRVEVQTSRRSRSAAEMHCLLSAYLDKLGRDTATLHPQGRQVSLGTITGDPDNGIPSIATFVNILPEQLRREETSADGGQSKGRYRLMLGTTGFHYEFSEGDLQRIQKLVDELRNLIAASAGLEQEHKQRVLSRLERLQSELHKKVWDLDRLLGAMIDVSAAIRTVGENAKPCVDILAKLAKIVRPAWAKAFDLPTNAPFTLPGATDDEES